MATALALRLSDVETFVPPEDYAEVIGSGIVVGVRGAAEPQAEERRAELEARRLELLSKSVAISNSILASIKTMMVEIERAGDLIHGEQAMALADAIEEREKAAARMLAFYRRTNAVFARMLAKTMTGPSASRPQMEPFRRSIREAMGHSAEDVNRQREVCIAYRDLRWSVIALAASKAERGPGPLISTAKEYAAQRRQG